MRFIWLLILLVACQPELDSPDMALKEFIEDRMERVVTKDYVLSRVTGKLKEAVENLAEEDFTKFSDLTAYQKKSFKIVSKTCQDKKCFITYTLSYSSMEKDKAVAKSESKKIAEVVLVEGKWLIAEVSNLKTYVESLAPIEPLNQ
jgi:hypothetical protein